MKRVIFIDIGSMHYKITILECYLSENSSNLLGLKDYNFALSLLDVKVDLKNVQIGPFSTVKFTLAILQNCQNDQILIALFFNP